MNLLILNILQTPQPNLGYEYLIANAKVGWVFDNISGSEGASITSVASVVGTSNPLTDNSGGLAPKRGSTQIGTTVYSGLRANTASGTTPKQALITTNQPDSYFQSDFEIDLTFNLVDGQGATNYLFGVSNGGTQVFRCSVNSSGNIVLEIAASASLSTFTCTGNAISNNYSGIIYLRIRADFTGDVLSVWVNGVPLTVSLTSGPAFSTINPASFFFNVRKLGVGGTWDGSFAADGISNKVLHRLYITPLKSAIDALYVGDYMTLRTGNSNTVYAQVNLSTQPIVKGASKTFGIALGTNAPSGDVTASFSSVNGYFTVTSSLTFTSSNFASPQAITLTGEAAGVVEGAKSDVLQVTLTGGGYSAVKYIPITVTDSGLDENFLKGFNWMQYVRISTPEDLTTKRESLINYVFNGNGIPTNETPASSTTGYTGLIYGVFHTSFTGWNSIDRHTFTMNDIDGYTWTYVNYHFKKSAGNGKCVLVCRGHGSELYSTELINQLLADGFDVWLTAMPSALENTETNPTITGAAVNAHNDMKVGGLDRVGYSPMELFFKDKIMALNYMDANYSYSEYYATGCSGGGYTTTFLMAIDERIKRGVHVRGFKPSYFCAFTDESLYGRDYEQYGGPTISGPRLESFLFNDVTFFDLIALAGTGNRTNHMSNHAADACCHNKFTSSLWTTWYKNYLSQLDCGFDFTLDTNASYTTHGWNVNDRSIVASVFN